MNLPIRRRVKLVCTLGPSSCSLEQITELIDRGMDVARLNFSHGTHEFHQRLIHHVREAARLRGRSVAILQDLQGPKLRVGTLPPDGIHLDRGDWVVLYPEDCVPIHKTQAKVQIPISAEIAKSVSEDAQVGSQVLFDDGRIATRIVNIFRKSAGQSENPAEHSELLVEVEVGGRLTSHKGINLPGTPLSIPCLTEKDLEDLKFGLEQEVDAVALSFVRAASDVENLKKEISKLSRLSKKTPLLVSKIERQEAIEDIDGIVKASDCLLIARGDMAVEIGAERVPTIQKRLIQICNQRGVPVITATQMLESMISSPTPTRAEASDVANAVFDGTDAVMLSGETASGSYPKETVSTMLRIVLEAERVTELYSHNPQVVPSPGSVVNAIEHSAATIAEQVGAVAIACFTHTGTAAKTLAKYRPKVPIVALTVHEEVLRKLAFVWGVHGVVLSKMVATDDLFTTVESVFKTQGWANPEDLVVVTAGIPTLKRGTTNMLKVHRIHAMS
jgi:pyruvate kinase